MSTQPTPASAPAPKPEVHTIKLPFPLQNGETITQLIHKHWFFLWPLTILWTLYAVVPVVVLYWLLGVIKIRDDLSPWYWLPILIWVGYWGIRLLLNLYRYQHDIWVIT